jgi:medium-chain acyl-[acyl-carrier-protein] hydrolase
LRLVCFPYAGGAAAAFNGWAVNLPAGTQICAIQLPGRAERWKEPVYTDVFQTVNKLAEILLRHLDGPFAMFGYSMGAQVAFELARALRNAGIQPACLFVAAHRAPHLSREHSPLHSLPDAEFIQEIARRYEAIPPAILEDDQILQLFLQALRADVAMGEAYAFTPAEPFSFPVSVFGGTSDRSVTQSELEAWRVHTTSSFKLRLLPGGHFFLRTSRQSMLEAIASDLREYANVD